MERRFVICVRTTTYVRASITFSQGDTSASSGHMYLPVAVGVTNAVPRRIETLITTRYENLIIDKVFSVLQWYPCDSADEGLDMGWREQNASRLTRCGTEDDLQNIKPDLNPVSEYELIVNIPYPLPTRDHQLGSPNLMSEIVCIDLKPIPQRLHP